MRFESAPIRFGRVCHIGKVRARNEDACQVLPDLGLAVVADGLGGHVCGDEASHLAVATIVQCVEVGMGLPDAILAAHWALRALAPARRRRDLPDMGTTVVAAQINDSGYRLVWVGDSRGYLWDGALHQITHDHSLVQEWIDAGELAEWEARLHPLRSQLTQTLGVHDAPPRMDSATGELAADARLLLCTDGLTGELDDIAIARELAATTDEQAVVDALVRQALAHGGADNVTAVVLSRSTH